VVVARTATETPATEDTHGISYGETVTGSVDTLDPVREDPTDNSHSGEFYYDPVTFEGEDGGVGNDSELVTRLPENGTYTIHVTSHFSETTFGLVAGLVAIVGTLFVAHGRRS